MQSWQNVIQAAGTQFVKLLSQFFGTLDGKRNKTVTSPLQLILQSSKQSSRPLTDRQTDSSGWGATKLLCLESYLSPPCVFKHKIHPPTLPPQQLTSITPSSSLPSTSLLFSTALSMVSNFTITASILDTMLPIECSILSTRLTSLRNTERRGFPSTLYIMYHYVHLIKWRTGMSRRRGGLKEMSGMEAV